MKCFIVERPVFFYSLKFIFSEILMVQESEENDFMNLSDNETEVLFYDVKISDDIHGAFNKFPDFLYRHLKLS